ncbi:YafY family transcriptional regulator (plasmid) [Clostridium estertheticum]|uniref:helix-turn-helix transcriptional regulator n=1 Tax=Clostridium estertheticum TaxID=238834 RepID=UPI001C7DE79A|nr:YafY family protein [Clostridium estertheticum]MBX4260449.1 YafY family transcriptional regulator [Clostridium estertheticum]WLC72974.1 YafY family transcriptional regulator [Clostridium estertheticum]
MKIDRLLGIISVLANRSRITVQELAERFEVSKRTIFRDLDTLSVAGVPIVTYSGIGGGVAVIEGYKLKNNILSKSDIKNVFTALNGLMSIDESTDLINLMAKLIPEETSIVFSESDYVIDLSSWFQDSITQEKVSDLHKAIKNRKCIYLEYISKRSRSARIIHPHKLVFKQSCWYLYAFCEDNQEFRLFKVNRIVDFKIMDAGFNCKVVEKIAFQNDFGANLFSSQAPTSLFEVILEYDATNEFFLTNKIDAKFFHRISSTKEKGQIIFSVSNLEWATNLVFSLQDKVKVIAPLALKEEVKTRIKRISELYKDDI